MQTYQRITENMFKEMPKYASIIMNLNSNHQIKSTIYKKNEKNINNISLALFISVMLLQ